MKRTTRTTPGVLDQYLRDVSHVPLLTVDEEQRLARAFRDHGDTRAAHRLVEANYVIQEGNIGLMKGVQDEELARWQEDTIVARRIDDAMSRLDDRERHIIRTRVMGDGGETLRVLGKHFGFSRERARQLQLRGLEKLRRELRLLGPEQLDR